jgi:hypothetical protein
MILALAGRRVDAPDAAVVRFPLENAVSVKTQISGLLGATQATSLVCSAACGSDLLALEAAHELGLDCQIILPFAKERFRATSVVDRPGTWGALFDKFIERAERAGKLAVLNLQESNDASYLAVNEAILTHARALAHSQAQPIEAALVWDGKSRDGMDITAAFASSAKSLGIPVREISTLPAPFDKMTAWPHKS